MEKNEITADWARKQVATILGIKVNQEVTKCLQEIEISVKNIQRDVSVNIFADDLTIKELEQRGFKVKQIDDQKNGSYLTIYW